MATLSSRSSLVLPSTQPGLIIHSDREPFFFLAFISDLWPNCDLNSGLSTTSTDFILVMMQRSLITSCHSLTTRRVSRSSTDTIARPTISDRRMTTIPFVTALYSNRGNRNEWRVFVCSCRTAPAQPKPANPAGQQAVGRVKTIWTPTKCKIPLAALPHTGGRYHKRYPRPAGPFHHSARLFLLPTLSQTHSQQNPQANFTGFPAPRQFLWLLQHTHDSRAQVGGVLD
ncbi:hypothetical protein CORC01_04411 [Colletotrichum orchidophilum]|uniref:Uncharacterized protein n=1 Tax=Colletotrichum orchidophilum TaxID=1209926 RepID=A0A1G4BFL0_9PEZI|nr:uncharacterized protein CORC01_04411 [Colletotrichum orchidophilum]OHF00222.1 hypothetical protein CORC01_04411 [Colletotrichum orchidophilum]